MKEAKESPNYKENKSKEFIKNQYIQREGYLTT